MAAVPDVTGAAVAPVVGPRFAFSPEQRGPMPTPDIMVVGQAWGPAVLPDAVVQISPTQVGYQDLFSTLGPDGQPARGMVLGTYAPTVGAMMRRQ